MKKCFTLILLAITVLCSFYIAAEDEKPVFKTLRCTICHKPDTGRAYPSLKAIAAAYNGDAEKLEKYLQGEEEPIVNKEKAKSMTRYIEKTKALSPDELKSLVDYILNFED
jgi:cytochrome c551/c552